MLNGEKQWAMILIFCGTLIILSKLGFLSTLISFIFPLLLMGLGYIGIKRGYNILGWFMIFIGLMIFITKFSHIISFFIALILIGIGIALWRKERTSY